MVADCQLQNIPSFGVLVQTPEPGGKPKRRVVKTRTNNPAGNATGVPAPENEASGAGACSAIHDNTQDQDGNTGINSYLVDQAKRAWPTIPAEMKQLPQWVRRGGNDGKVPKNPRNQEWNAQADNQKTWGKFNIVKDYPDIGFELLDYIGIDFDHIWRYETPFCLWARDWAARFALVTYNEYSMSMVGAHVFGNGDWIVPETRKMFEDPDAPLVLKNRKWVHDAGVQISTPRAGKVIDKKTRKERDGVVGGRFYAITGKPLEGSPSTITDIAGIAQEFYDELCDRFEIEEHREIGQDEEELSIEARILKMRQPFQDLLDPTKGLEIHGLCAKTGKPEFLYWKALFIEGQACGITPQELYPYLKLSQINFDEKTTDEQLPCHVFSYSKPFTNKKLNEMFPGVNLHVNHPANGAEPDNQAVPCSSEAGQAPNPAFLAHYHAGQTKENVDKDFYMYSDGITEVVSWTDKKGNFHEIIRKIYAWIKFMIHRIINDKNPNPIKRYDFLLNENGKDEEYRDMTMAEMLKLGPFQPILTGVVRHLFEHMVDLYVQNAQIPEQETADVCGLDVDKLSLPPEYACRFPTGIQENLRDEVEKIMKLPILSREEAIEKFNKLRDAISFPHRDIIMTWAIGSFYAHALQRAKGLMIALALWGPGGVGRSEIMKKMTIDFWGVNEVISADTFNSASRALDYLAVVTFPRTIDEIHKIKPELLDLLKDYLGSHGKKRGTRKRPDQTLAMNNELDTPPSFIWQEEIPTIFEDAYLLQRFLVLHCEPFERTQEQIDAWESIKTVEEGGSMVPGELGRYFIECTKTANRKLVDLLKIYNATPDPDKLKLTKEAKERFVIEYKTFYFYKTFIKEFFDADMDLENLEELISETRLLCSDLVFDAVEQLCAISYVHSCHNSSLPSRPFNTLAFFTETNSETHEGTMFHLSSLNCAEIGMVVKKEKYGLGDLNSIVSRKWTDCKLDNNKKVEGKYPRAIHVPYSHVAEKIDELIQLENYKEDSNEDGSKKQNQILCKYGCGTEITFSDLEVSESGKKIPLDKKTLKPHQCGKNPYYTNK